MNWSMNWDVRVSKSVKKRVKRFYKKDCERVLQVLNEFRINPWGGDITKMDGKDNLWRRRVGNYRIFYSIQVGARAVEVKEVERRTSSTY